MEVMICLSQGGLQVLRLALSVLFFVDALTGPIQWCSTLVSVKRVILFISSY